MQRDRRQLLGLLCGAIGSASAAGALLAACHRAPPPPQPLRVPLAELAAGERRRLQLPNGDPVELRRTDQGVEARSLLCTHFGCEVRWDEPEGIYACPCHEGRFDAAGRVIGGPPNRPLSTLPVRIEGDQVVLDPAAREA